MIATNNFDDYDNYKNLFLIKDGFKISFHKCKDVIPIIIDKIKKIFGLESMNRKLIVFPSYTKYYTEEHRGYERFIDLSEVNNSKVFKIRVFRWLVGLPSKNSRADIIVRIESGKKTFISYSDLNLDYSRNLNFTDNSECYSFDECIKEMIYGYRYDTLKRDLLNIINSIDSEYIFLAESILRKLNLYGYL